VSFIDIVERDKFPAAVGQFKDEAYRRVFFVVWSLFERTVNLIAAGGFFLRFGTSKTLRGVGLAFKNFVITAQEVFLVLYRFYPIGIDTANFVISVTAALSPATTADLNFFQNVEKSVCAKAFENDNRIKTPANQACPRITRINANEFSSEEACGSHLKVVRIFIDPRHEC